MMRAMPLRMTCRELDALMDDYVEGRLSGYDRLRFALHLRICRLCRRYLAAYRRTIEAVRTAFDDATEELPEELLHSILSPQRPDTD